MKYVVDEFKVPLSAADDIDVTHMYTPSSLVRMGSKNRVKFVVRPEVTES